jgi:hypothetical protein
MTGRDVLHSGFRHRYPPPVQVLLQSLVQLGQPPKLELGHGLFPGSTIVVGADFVRRSRHDCGGTIEALFRPTRGKSFGRVVEGDVDARSMLLWMLLLGRRRWERAPLRRSRGPNGEWAMRIAKREVLEIGGREGSERE